MIASTENFPLKWPLGQNRTKYPKDSRFSVKFGAVRDSLVKQLRLMGAKNIVISTNVPLKADNLPYANYSGLHDHGAAVYFTYKEKQMVFACDRWRKVEDNLHAISKTIDAIRGIERWGSSDMLEQAFSGFAQLEAPKEPGQENWWDVLGVFRNAPVAKIMDAWKDKLKEHHPDRGGKTEDAVKINGAYAEARKERGF